MLIACGALCRGAPLAEWSRDWSEEPEGDEDEGLRLSWKIASIRARAAECHILRFCVCLRVSK